jgi:hypothetical protein
MTKRSFDDDDSATSIYEGPGAPKPPILPLKVISLKSPQEIAADPVQKTPDLPKPQIRAMPSRRHPTPPSGNLAPPRVSAMSIRRQLVTPAAIAAMVAIAACVGLGIWLLATR